jgi:hypothetical protein
MRTLVFPRLIVAAGIVMSAASRVAAQSPIVPDGSAVGLTRFEIQRALLEVDE